MSDKNFKVKNGLDANGAVTITQPSTSTVPLTILANTLATGSNLLEVKRPDGTVRFAVGNDGALTVNSNISFNGGSMSMYPGNSEQTALSVFGQTNQSVANLIVRAATGQSGNLQEWRDQNNNVAARIGPDFAFRSIAGGFFGTATGNIVGSNYLGVRGWAEGHIPFVVQGVASQTGDLTRWVDSSANTLAKVDASGSITAVDLTLSGNLTVNGTTTNLNSTNLIIEDKNIIIADVATPTDTTADGAGITIKGATDKTLTWVNSTKSFTTSDPLIIDGTNSTTVPLLVKVPTAQTTNSFEVQDSRGYSMFKVIAPAGGTAYNNGAIWIRPWGIGNVAAMGTDSYQGFYFVSPAASTINFGTGGGGKAFEIVVGDTFNRYKVEGKGTGVAPIFTTNGNDTDVNMHIYPKGAGKIGVNTTTPTGYVHIKTPSASVSTLIVQGESSQSANLTEWHNSAGTVLSRIDAGGNIVSPYVYTSLLQNTTAGKANLQTNQDTGAIGIYTSASANKGLIVRGAASQTANLQEWQDSAGNVISNINSAGNIFTISAIDLNFIGKSTPNAPYLDASFTASNSFSIVQRTTTAVNLIIRAAASQTANLQEWQDSAGNLLSAIRSDGVLRVSQIISKENYSSFFTFSSGSPIQVNPLTAGTVAIVVKGGASQTANLQDWQNSAGTVLASISPTGKLTSASDALINGITLGWGGGQSYQNLVFGYSALSSNTTGVLNMAMGYRALQSNTTGWNNMALGADALVANTTGQANTAVGAQSLYGNINGGENVAIGNWALLSGNGAYNTAVGASSMNLNSSSQFNTAVGRLSLYSISYGSHNTAIGQQAGAGLTSGASNAILGSEALILATTGSSNVAVGRDAGHSVVTGSANVFLGYQAGYSETGSNKLYISNSDTATPLIGGDFSAKTLTVAGNATITSQATGTVGLIVKAIASQTANLQEWQNSSGAVLAAINPVGQFFTGSVPFYTTASTTTAASGNGTTATITTTSAHNIAVGDFISVSGITPAGYNGTYLVTAVPTSTQISYANTTTGSQTVAGSILISAQATITARSNMSIGLTVKAGANAPAQTWQNSLGAQVARVDNTGNIVVAEVIASNLIAPFGYALIGTSYSRFSTAMISVASTTAASQGIIVRGAASQTANLQEWQNSAGTVGAYVASDGSFVTRGSLIGGSYSGSALFGVQNYSTTQVVAVVKGAASQTANLQEWQNSSGTALVNISSSGVLNTNANINLIGVSANGLNRTIDYGASYGAAALYLYNAGANARWGWGLNAGEMQFFATNDSATNHFSWNRGGDLQAVGTNEIMRLTVGTGATSTLNLNTGGTAATGLVIKGVASQTANLQEWQNSSGTALASLASNGDLLANAFISTNGVVTGSLSFSNISYNGFSNPAGHTNNPTVVIRGIASQTADLAQWRNSANTTLALVDAYGRLGINTTSLANSTGGYSMVSIYNNNTVNTNLVIKSYPSQTATLTEWQNSSGTTLAKIDVLGNFTATSKSFDIEHPTKENMRLRYGSLEGPENGVYIRGTIESNVIELPEYWTELVHKDSITASLTSVGSAQNIYVEKIENNKIYIGGNLEKAFFTVYGERKDIDKLTVEY